MLRAREGLKTSGFGRTGERARERRNWVNKGGNVVGRKVGLE